MTDYQSPDYTPEEMAALQARAKARFEMMKKQDDATLARVPLAPKLIAWKRRRAGDPNQFAWDVEANPKTMLEALRAAIPQAVLLPVARFMDATTTLARAATGGRALVSQTTMIQTLWSAARLLRNGDIDGAVDFMMPIRRLVTPGGTVEDIRKLFADVIRSLYPAAPITYKAPAGFVPPPVPALPDEGMDIPQLEGGSP